MTYLPFVGLFFRQSALASACLLLFACIAERLAPGSVLSYVALWKLVAATVLLQLLGLLFPLPPSRARDEFERVLVFGGGLGAVLFFFLTLRDGGDRALLLVGASVLVLLLSVLSFRRVA